jgi:hypothetical protein
MLWLARGQEWGLADGLKLPLGWGGGILQLYLPFVDGEANGNPNVNKFATFILTV